MKNDRLNVELADLSLKNPIITASGTFGFGNELNEFFSSERLGAITLKGISKKLSLGNKLPRIVETPSGILNSIGLENPGLDKFKKDIIPELEKFDLPVIANISGSSVDDFVYLAESLAPFRIISGIEVNVSCPNLKSGGMAFGTDSDLIFEITQKVKSVYPGPVIVKLTPNVTDIVEMAESAVEGGADILSLINTLLGMAIDIDRKKPVLGNIFGGLSGPAIKPVAIRMVYQVTAAVDIPVIGMGGIMHGRDVIEFMLAGATAVGVGTATLVDPTATIRIISELEEYLAEKEISDINDIIGKAHNKEE